MNTLARAGNPPEVPPETITVNKHIKTFSRRTRTVRMNPLSDRSGDIS